MLCSILCFQNFYIFSVFAAINNRKVKIEVRILCVEFFFSSLFYVSNMVGFTISRGRGFGLVQLFVLESGGGLDIEVSIMLTSKLYP